MKLFWTITGAIAALFILALIGLNLYMTDDRLRGMILPPVNEALEREVQLERITFTFFRTFPRFGLLMEGFELPGDTADEPVAAFDRLTLSVKLFPLFRNELDISRLDIERPKIHYRVYADSTSNIDFLITGEEPETETETAFEVRIPALRITGGALYYRDEPSGLDADLESLDARLGFRFADQIETDLDAELGSLTVRSAGEELVRRLPLRLQQVSSLDMERERLTIDESRLSIRGFRLNLEGSFEGWSREAPLLDLQFRSSSEDFGELLGLVPEQFEDHLQGLRSGGSLTLHGRVSGELRESEIPDFEAIIQIRDGWLQNPDLEDPIEQINLSLDARNERIVLEEFRATAAGNRIEATGRIDRPFDDDAPFSFRFGGDLDLGTLSRFYPLGEAGIEELEGSLNAQGEGEGVLNLIEEMTFSGSFRLQNGRLKYADVAQAVERIEAEIDASQDRVDIHHARLEASSNRFSASGTITSPLADQPSFDLDAELSFDLGTLGNFYPIDEDTLTIRGQLDATATLRGQADQIERALQQSRIELRNGYISHRSTRYPLEEITFTGEAGSRQLQIREARFRTGENRFSLSGTVTDYLEDEPVFDLQIDGSGLLADLTEYYSLEPWIQELTGSARLDLRAAGPAGDPTAIRLNGSMQLQDVTARGDSLLLPVTDLRGDLRVTPDRMNLESFFMRYGRSDFALQGELRNYLGFLNEHSSEQTMPAMRGSYHSRLLDMDEMIDWDSEAEEEPIPIELPQMTGQVEARIDSLIIFETVITNLRGNGEMGPDRMVIENATADMFDGTAAGRMRWNIPQPDRTNLRFVGELNELQVQAFFREFPIFGDNSRFEQYLSGTFSADVDYYTELDVYIDPDITTTRAEGTFGMTRARLNGHPIQEQMARWLGTDELRSLALDEWNARFRIRDSVLELEDFRLTSEGIGIELDGTQHLVTDEIDFTAQLSLPSRFGRGLSSVLSSQVVDALSRDDGIIVVPVRITGTMKNPRITPRQTVIENLLRDRVRDTGRDLLRGLFN